MLAWRTPGFGGKLGAPHAMDIPFLLGSHREPLMEMFLGRGPDRDRLSRTMQDAWTTFARDGVPAPRGAWARFDPERRATTWLDREVELREDDFARELAVWRPVFADLFRVDGVDRTPSASPLRGSVYPIAL